MALKVNIAVNLMHYSIAMPFLLHRIHLCVIYIIWFLVHFVFFSLKNRSCASCIPIFIVSFVLICDLIKRIARRTQFIRYHTIPIAVYTKQFQALLMFCAIYVYIRLHWHGLSIRELLPFLCLVHFPWLAFSLAMLLNHRRHTNERNPKQTIILSNHNAHRTENCKTHRGVQHSDTPSIVLFSWMRAFTHLFSIARERAHASCLSI